MSQDKEKNNLSRSFGANNVFFLLWGAGGKAPRTLPEGRGNAVFLGQRKKHKQFRKGDNWALTSWWGLNVKCY